MTANDVPYLQFENIHITFVTEMNKRSEVMTRPKSSLCMYTSKNMPRYVVQPHMINVVMYRE